MSAATPALQAPGEGLPASSWLVVAVRLGPSGLAAASLHHLAVFSLCVRVSLCSPKDTPLYWIWGPADSRMTSSQLNQLLLQ